MTFWMVYRSLLYPAGIRKWPQEVITTNVKIKQRGFHIGAVKVSSSERRRVNNRTTIHRT